MYYEVQPPVSGKWGSTHANLIEDAVTHARRVFDIVGPQQALADYEDELERMVSLKTWRSAAAFDMLMYLRRQSEYQLDRVEAGELLGEYSVSNKGIIL
jgi:hypothetical protein